MQTVRKLNDPKTKEGKDDQTKIKEERLRRSVHTLSTPRNVRLSAADLYSRQNSFAKAPKKLASSTKRQESPMKDVFKASPKIVKDTPKTLRASASALSVNPPRKPSYTNVTVNTPAKKQINPQGVIGERLKGGNLKGTERFSAKQQDKRNGERKEGSPRHRAKTRTLDDDEVKVLTPDVVDNNAEMQNLTKKLTAQAKAFYVDIGDKNGETSKENKSDEEPSYEDDFESYESDFDSYHSGDGTSDESLVKSDEVIGPDDRTFADAVKEENMLDSGNFDLREPRSIKPPTMDYIVENCEQQDKKVSLTDEGFQDMSSSSVGSSMKTVHVDVLERPLFIDFTKSKEKKRKRRVFANLKQRATDILNMVTLHAVSYSLYEMKPIPYDVYMATFGRANYTQIAVQTFDDGVAIEVQTDDIEYGNKWTQCPVEFSNEMIHINNEEKHICLENNTSNSDIDLQYKINPLRIYFEQRCGAGDDKMLPYAKYLSKLKDKTFDAKKLGRFLRKSERRISDILNMNAGNTVTGSRPSKFSFSKGYVTISMKKTIERLAFLKKSSIIGTVLPDTKDNVVLTLHSCSEVGRKCVICVWDLSVASTEPVKYLLATDKVKIGRFRGAIDGVFVAALQDGTVHLWDLADTTGITYGWNGDKPEGEDLDQMNTQCKMQLCAFTSSAWDMGTKEVLDCIVGLEYLVSGNTVALENGDRNIGRVCVLHKRGIMTFYSIIKEKRNKTHELGKAFWSKIKLEKSQTICLFDYISTILDRTCDNYEQFNLSAARRRFSNKARTVSRQNSAILSRFDSSKREAKSVDKAVEDFRNSDAALICNCLRVIHSNNIDYYLIAKNCGEVLLCQRTFGVVKVERFNVTSDTSSVTSMEVSSTLAYFLVATDCGTIHLCSLQAKRVLLTLDCGNVSPSTSEKCQADSRGRFAGVKQVTNQSVHHGYRCSITSLSWSKSDPFSVVAVSSSGDLTVWKLTHSDIHPYDVYEKAALHCETRDNKMALLVSDSEVQIHTIDKDKDNYRIFEKYISLL